jgi:hypothetical protein
MADTTPCSQCGTLVPADVEFCPNCNFYMSWAKDPEDEESAARSPRLPDEEVAPKPAPPAEPMVEAGDPCPKCQTPNAPARVFCRRCGHDLRAPVAAPAPPPVDEGLPPWLIPVLVGSALVALIVLWALFFRNGDQTTTTETSVAAAGTSPTTATTSAPSTTAAPVIEALGVEQISVTASSSIPGDSYVPENMLDGVLETAWNHCGTSCEETGAARQGVGQTLQFDFDEDVTLTGFRIANGYQKQSEAAGDVWVKNNRIRQIVVTTADGSETVELADERGYQTINIQQATTDFLTIEVTGVYEGDGTYNDLAVSEIEILVQTN